MPLSVSPSQFFRLNDCFQPMLGRGQLFLSSFFASQAFQFGLSDALQDRYYKLLFLVKYEAFTTVNTQLICEELRRRALQDPRRWSEFIAYDEQSCRGDLMLLINLSLIKLPSQIVTTVVNQNSAISSPSKPENEVETPSVSEPKNSADAVYGKRKSTSPVDKQEPSRGEPKETKDDELMAKIQLELKAESEKSKGLEKRVKKLESEVKELKKSYKKVSSHPEIMTLAILKVLGWKPSDNDLSSSPEALSLPSSSSSSAVSLQGADEVPPYCPQWNSNKFLTPLLASSQQFLTFSPLSTGQSKEVPLLQPWLLTDSEGPGAGTAPPPYQSSRLA